MVRSLDRSAERLNREGLPILRGVAFATAYRPASDEGAVGRDWYDVFNLPDRRVAISVGDVAGHGLEAAMIMAEVRRAIRKTAAEADGPAAVLDYVNRIVALRESMGMVSAICGFYDPESSALSYAVAGHPPPLLSLASGFVRRLPAGGLPLGCADALEAIDCTVTLPAGSCAIFHTDGGATKRDDAAALLLSRSDPVDSYVFSAVPVVAPIARAIVEHEMAELVIDAERRFGVLVALGEAIANAIEHAYRGGNPGLIRLAIERRPKVLVLTVEDFGRWRPFIRCEERGRGFELMHAFMDSVQIFSTRQSTKIVLKTKVRS